MILLKVRVRVRSATTSNWACAHVWVRTLIWTCEVHACDPKNGRNSHLAFYPQLPFGDIVTRFFLEKFNWIRFLRIQSWLYNPFLMLSKREWNFWWRRIPCFQQKGKSFPLFMYYCCFYIKPWRWQVSKGQ